MAIIAINNSFSVMPQPQALRVGLLLYPGCMPAGLFAFSDILHGANRRAGARLFETSFVSVQAGDIECAHGQFLKAVGSIHGVSLDAILLPGFWAESLQQVSEMLSANSRLIAALSGLPKSVMMWSYCTGVCLLASAGRLNRKKATATWWMADALRKSHPGVIWQCEQTSIFSSRTATASGVNGYLPIVQALIERRLSAEAYRDLTKLMVLPRPETTHHAFQTMTLIEQPDRLLRQLFSITEQIPAAEVTVHRLAKELGTSERTLARKVSAATGLSLASYLRRIKLNQVGERLILTSAPASTISDELGFSSDSNMRRMFKDLTHLTTTEYRHAFGRS